MLLPLRPICKEKNIRRDGTSLIYIQYCYSSENRTLLNTNIAVPPVFWNKKKLCINSDLPVSFGKADELNSKLTRLLRFAQDLVCVADRKNITDRVNFLRKAFYLNMQTESLELESEMVEKIGSKVIDRVDVFAQIEDYIKCKERRVTSATVNVYRAMKQQLKDFESFRKNKITFNSFDYDFYETFVDFLRFEYVQHRRKTLTIGLKSNTIGKTIKQLRIFIKDRAKRKIIAPIDLSDFKVLEEETDAIYLTYNEIASMHKTDLSQMPFLIEYSDLFVFACLSGLRFSDFSTLKLEDLRNDMLFKKQRKSEHWVVVPLRNEARKIFLQHFKDKTVKLTNPEFNRHIKTIGKLAGITEPVSFSFRKGNKLVKVTKPKYEWITSHTARRSFCTNEFLAGTPVKLIMKISGHKSEKDFYRYIRISAEEAAQKIQQIWIERNHIL